MSVRTPLESGGSTVLAVEEDDRCVAAAFEPDEQFEVRLASTPADARSRTRDVDCVVYAPAAPVETALLERVRACDETLPFVLVAEAPPDDVRAAVRDDPWADHVDASARDRLVDCVRRLVELHRGAVLASRNAGEGRIPAAVAVVAPERTVEAATAAYADRFGYDRGELRGRSWHDLHPRAEVDRLEASAVPTVADGWQWTGRCTCRTRSGELFTVRTTFVGVPDGRFVVAIRDDAPAE